MGLWFLEGFLPGWRGKQTPVIVECAKILADDSRDRVLNTVF